jgi:pimeloyl-ACP methyl ester carboxylesterase
VQRHRGPHDRIIRLRDGRTLGFSDLGDPDGFPVVYCHGGLSCRIDAASAAAPARSAGIRVLALDRPGIGLSQRNRGFTLADWTADVRDVTEQLGLDRFAAMGWSFGGAYAAAIGSYLPDSVSDVVLIASGIPRDWPGMIDGINSMDRSFLRLSGTGSILDRTAFVAMRVAASRAPRQFVRATVRGLSPQSRAAILRDPQEFVRATTEGLSDPAGVVDDYRIWNAPWGFDLAELSMPVHLWHGSHDELCPPEWSHRLAAVIPEATVTVVPGAGHWVARDHWSDILAAVVR